MIHFFAKKCKDNRDSGLFFDSVDGDKIGVVRSQLNVGKQDIPTVQDELRH